MPYSLDSFGPEIWRNDAPFNPDRPTSIEHAIEAMDDEEFAYMVEDLFGVNVPPDSVFMEDILDKIAETNTVTNLESPVEVWVDDEANYTLLVYDPDDRKDNPGGLQKAWNDAAKAANEAFEYWAKIGLVRLYVVAKYPNEVFVVDEEYQIDPETEILVTPQPLPRNVTKEQLTRHIYNLLRRVPYLGPTE